MERSYIYFYGGEGRKYSVYISPDDGSCIKCPAPAGRGSMGYLIAAVLVVLIASTFSGLLKELLKPHPGIVIAMLAAAVLAGVLTGLLSRNRKENLIRKNGQPLLKSEISNGHIALATRQLKTDRFMLLLLVAATLLFGFAFFVTCHVSYWLIFIGVLVILGSLAGSMDLRARREMVQWLSVYQSHPEWNCMLQFSGGYLTMTKNGRRFPENNIRAVNNTGTVLWDIGSIQKEPVRQGYMTLERIDKDTFRVQSVMEEEYILHADIPSLVPVPAEKTTE